MDNKTSIKKNTNADMLKEISGSVKSLQRQTSSIRNDLSYIKAYLDIKEKQNKIQKLKNELEEEESTETSGSWWWG